MYSSKSERYEKMGTRWAGAQNVLSLGPEDIHENVPDEFQSEFLPQLLRAAPRSNWGERSVTNSYRKSIAVCYKEKKKHQTSRR